jgi:Cu(I)/Ag(I) efflux system periplasmic protein CusF
MAFWFAHSLPRMAISAMVAGLPNMLLVAPLRAAQVETAATGVFHGVGVVKDIQRSTGALTLDHEDIKGLMPAMIMMYRVKTPAVSQGLEVGDRVEFQVDAKSYTILSARRIAPKP